MGVTGRWGFMVSRKIIGPIIVVVILAHKTPDFLCNGRYCVKTTKFSTKIFFAKGNQSEVYFSLIYCMKIKFWRFHTCCAKRFVGFINPSNVELNPICHLLALLGIHHILHVSRIGVNYCCLVWVWTQKFRYNSCRRCRYARLRCKPKQLFA